MPGWERRRELEHEVEVALSGARDGLLRSAAESSSLDFKEEAGRRTRTGELEPGRPENQGAATKLADEVACFANSPGGGVILLGVADKTGEVVGTELDVDWLRHRIYRAVDVAPDIVEHAVDGQRVLALYVEEAVEPVENTQGAIRWRIGRNCEPVDRASWWARRQLQQGADSMAARSSATSADVSSFSLERVRRILGADRTEPDSALLMRLGATQSDGHLTQAAALLLTSQPQALIDLTVLDVPGGMVLNHIEPEPGLSMLEQIDVIERACDVANTGVTLGQEFAHQIVRRVPVLAIREAILNGMIHRDWNTRRPTEVRWIDTDSTLLIRSPGGFTGGVTADNLLTHRHPRHPALADLFRALGLVEKQGLGVDRMYTAMIRLGHRPPQVVETPGPHVECQLVGGAPHTPVMALMNHIRPEARQRDVRIVILVDALMRKPFLTDAQAAVILQADALSVKGAFDAASQTTIAGAPLIRRYKDVWILGHATFDYALRAHDPQRADPVMAYAGSEELAATVQDWLTVHEAISTGDLMELTRASRTTAQRALAGLEGRLVRRTGAGRSTRFVRV